MKIINGLKLFLLVFLVNTTNNLSYSQCNPSHISYRIDKNINDIFEVYIKSDVNYNFPNFVSNSSLIGLTFPSGYTWTGGPNAFLNVNGNQGNGNWSLGNLDEEPSCGTPNTDYVYGFMSSTTNITFVANQWKLVFTFELPESETCEGFIALLENTDPYVINEGCGSISTANFIAMSGEGGGACNNYLNNVDNNGIDCSLAPLPVELLDFRVTLDGKKCNLDWATSSETNNKGFEIQRSTNGKDWDFLGWVDGNGTTNFRHDYQFVDDSPAYGTNYYRLKQFDYDGTSEFSPVRTVNFKSDLKRASIYPNPTSGELNIQMPEFKPGKVAFHVFDLRKNMVYEQTLDYSEENFYQFDFSNLPPAVYMLKVKYPQGEEYHSFILSDK